MASVTSVSLVDDLDGGEANETISFSLDGKELEIDLSSKHAAELRDALAPYIGAARKVTGRRSYARITSPRAASNRDENQQIRAWAVEQGMKISERGRIPGAVIEAYRDRGNARPAPAAEFQAAEAKPKRRSRKSKAA